MAENSDNKDISSIALTVKWGGKEYKIVDLSLKDTTVGDLKHLIKDRTGVLPQRQKLLGMNFKGKPAADDVSLSSLHLKPNAKIMMMGTREEKLEEVISPSAEIVNNEVINDLDIEEEEILIENREVYLAKIEKRVKDYQLNMISQPRQGKKLLVLDVDYTLFDHRSVAENVNELKRPYLHEFLSAAYADYDIVIWSATSMKWVEVKMKELGVLDNPNFKIMFMMDSAAMITIDAPKYGVIETKPLGVIWGKFEEYSNQNTIMFDDLRRNFIMNPQNGLKIRPFREAFKNRDTDNELLRLSKYLKEIASLDDLSFLDHRRWERYKNMVKNGTNSMDWLMA